MREKNLLGVAVLFFSVVIMIGYSEPAKTVQASNQPAVSSEPVLAKDSVQNRVLAVE